MSIDGGVFSDNRWDLLITRGNKVIVDNALIMGYSPEFQAVVAARGSAGTTKHCLMDGITVRWQANDGSSNTMSGATFRNTEFRHFEDASCSSQAIELVRVKGTHPSQLVLSGLTWGDGTSSTSAKFQLCNSNGEGIRDVFWEDADGYLNPNSANSGFVIHQADEVTPSLLTAAGSSCSVLADSCAQYCEGACLRSVTILVDSNASPDPDALVLEITHSSGGSAMLAGHQGSILVHEYGQVVNKRDYYPDVSRGRFFTFALPQGSYTARFLDNSTSTSVYPNFVKEWWGDEPTTSCSPSYTSPTLTFASDVPPATCDSLIKGGTFEGVNALTWWHTTGNAGISLVGAGHGKSATTLRIANRASHHTGAAQWIDSRCLTTGFHYEFQAYVKLLDSNGNGVSCATGALGWGASGSCPEFQLFGYNADGTTFHKLDVGFAVDSSSASDGWTLIYGIAKFDDATISSSERVNLRINGGDAGLDLLVDDVTMNRWDPDCDALVFNGDAEVGDTRGWRTMHGSGQISVVDGGALGTSKAFQMSGT